MSPNENSPMLSQQVRTSLIKHLEKGHSSTIGVVGAGGGGAGVSISGAGIGVSTGSGAGAGVGTGVGVASLFSTVASPPATA